MKLAIITGTTRGLGEALKANLSAEGWEVAEISRAQFDLSNLDHHAADKFMRSLTATPRARAVLVHNASEMHIAPTSQSTEAARRIIQVNLVSVIELTGIFLKYFPSGEVAGITSSAARAGVAHWPLYCAAKAGMEGFIRAVKAEGITTHLFEPGVIDTDMQKMIRETDWPGANQFAGYHSAGRLKAASEVAGRIVRGISTPTSI